MTGPSRWLRLAYRYKRWACRLNENWPGPPSGQNPRRSRLPVAGGVPGLLRSVPQQSGQIFLGFAGHRGERYQFDVAQRQPPIKRGAFGKDANLGGAAGRVVDRKMEIGFDDLLGRG